MDEQGQSVQTDYQAPGVERCLQILELLAQFPAGLTLSEMTDKLGVPKNAVFRISMTMQQAGFLRRHPESMRFVLARKLLSIAYAAIGDESLVEKSRDIMRGLRDLTRETVVLGTLLDTEGIALEQFVALHPLKFTLETGFHFPLHAGAPGKALLAFLPAAERQALLQRLKFTRFTANTITGRTAFAAELRRVQALGYALDRAEGFWGCHCVGAPIFDQHHYPVACLWVTGPSDRLPASRFAELGAVVRTHADRISARLGARSSAEASP